MNYGHHTELVQEVLDFVENGKIFRPSALVKGDRLYTIRDLAEAKEYAYRRYITDDEDAANWSDLREAQVAEVLREYYKDPAFLGIRDLIWNLLDRITESLQMRMPDTYRDMVDDIAADLDNCALSRAVFGTGNRFFELLWHVYQQGGWPCGWVGNYPDGQLVVYEPPSLK